MDLAPYLAAVQSLGGRRPQDKYKELHAVAAQIMKNLDEREKFLSDGISDRVRPALFPHLRIIVANELKLAGLVIEALRSDDVTIVKRALGARWFFDASNELLNADYFAAKVLPLISLRTRLELIKALAGNVKEPKKAEEFFNCVADMYGIDQALPLISACGENFIFDEILKRRLVLCNRTLGVLYRKYPQLVVRYLQLGNERNEDNRHDRKKHKILLQNYLLFLPLIVKRHTKEFIDLYECVPQYAHSMKLGRTRTIFFLEKATDTLIEKPEIFLKKLSLKIVVNKLSTNQFQTMFKNFFLKLEENCVPATIINYLEYYEQEKQVSLLQHEYELFCNEDFMIKIMNKISDSYFAMMVFGLLRADLREKIGRKKLETMEGLQEYTDYLYYLPPKESIPLLKEKIETLAGKSRSQWIKQMITSCALYDSKDNLLEVLHYYNDRHKNEHPDVLGDMLDEIMQKFDAKSLDKAHWKILKDIIQRAYVKGDLYSMSNSKCESIFRGALYYFLNIYKLNKLDNEDEIFLDNLIGIIIEGYLEHKMKWKFIEVCPEVDKVYLQKVLAIISQKYPLEHVVWCKFINKLNLIIELLQGMCNYNVRNDRTKRNKSKVGFTNAIAKKEIEFKFIITDYPWLMDLIKQLLKTDLSVETCGNKIRWLVFRELLRKHEPKCYQQFIDDDSDLINDVASKDALLLLKNDQDKVLLKWPQYLSSCKNLLNWGCKSTKQFIAATIWYQDVPVFFIQQCLLEIPEKGSFLVLGILLEGKSFGKIIEAYLPKNKKLDTNEKDAKLSYEIASYLARAISGANPPVSFDVIVPFCEGDYLPLATQILMNVARCIPVNAVLDFAHKLVDKPISVKKLGIRLILEVAAKNEAREFLMQIWKLEKNLSIKEVIVKMIFTLFKQSPSEETWELMKICIKEVTGDGKIILDHLTNVKGVDKNFVALYIQELLRKMDSLIGENLLVEEIHSNIMNSLVNKLDVNILHVLPEDLITNIIKRKFFRYSDDFRFSSYLFNDASKFEKRLKTILEIVETEMKGFSLPHPKMPRLYPSNRRLRLFFYNMIQHLVAGNYENSLTTIESFLHLFLTLLKPWQDPQSYIGLNICEEFFDLETKSSLRNFGARLGKRLGRIVKEITIETIVRDIADVLITLQLHSNINKMDFELSVIEGMMESDHFYGTLVGINMLYRYDVDIYDKRFDKLMDTWRKDPSTAIQAELSLFVNNIDSLTITSFYDNSVK